MKATMQDFGEVFSAHTEHDETLISKVIEKDLDIRVHYELKKLSIPENCLWQWLHKNIYSRMNKHTLKIVCFNLQQLITFIVTVINSKIETHFLIFS